MADSLGLTIGLSQGCTTGSGLYRGGSLLQAQLNVGVWVTQSSLVRGLLSPCGSFGGSCPLQLSPFEKTSSFPPHTGASASMATRAMVQVGSLPGKQGQVDPRPLFGPESCWLVPPISQTTSALMGSVVRGPQGWVRERGPQRSTCHRCALLPSLSQVRSANSAQASVQTVGPDPPLSVS